MKTVRKTLADSSKRLHICGIESASLDAELLLATVLTMSREQLLASAHKKLSQQEEAQFVSLLRRRLEGEPVSYICRRAYFYGHEFYLEPGVLCPRPDSELLVERALAWLDKRGEPAVGVADIGTGSGCIAVSLALARPEIKIYATEISGLARKVAAENIKQHQLEGRVFLLAGNLGFPLPEKVDLLVANLPYGTTAGQADFSPEVTREPARAIHGGADGLDLIKELLVASPKWLHPNGGVILEFDPRQKRTLEKFIDQKTNFTSVFHKDMNGKDRVVVLD